MKKAWIALALSLAMVAGLAGCAQKETAEGPKPLTIVLDYVPNTNHTGIYVAVEKGYFAEEGFDVNIIQPPDEGASLSVASGDAQIGIDFQDLMAPALVGDKPLGITAVAAILQHNTSGIVSLKCNGIDRPKGLEGKTYASWESPVELAIIKNCMEADGGDYEKLHRVPNAVTDTFAALKTDIDAVWIYYGWDGVAAKVKGIPIDYFNFADINPVLDYYTPVFIANNQWLTDHPGVAKSALRALKKGYTFAAEHPEEAAEILMKEVPEMDPELIKASQAYLSEQYIADAPYWGYIDPARWDGFYRWLVDEHLVDGDLPEGTGFSNDYLDKSR